MYTIQDLRDKNLIVFETIVGSTAYGTNTPESDVDIKGIYIQPIEDILSFNYIPQISDEKNDTTFFEIRRFLELLLTNNPTVLEILYAPLECIIYKNPIIDNVINQKDKFLTKLCKHSFGQYAVQQINKAQGYNKKINWEESSMTRKSVLDFCYVMSKGESIPFKKWLEIENDKIKESNKSLSFPFNMEQELYKQEDFGLASVNNARDLYAMYDVKHSSIFNRRGNEILENKAGIVDNEETSNDVKLTSIPKGLYPIAYLSFNKDGYSCHCKKYKEYTEWLEKRNQNRFKMNKAHGKNYDSKNLMHCFRLLETAIEIGEGKGILVKRPNIDKLMSIRKGEYEFDDLITEANALIKNLDEVYLNSSLHENVDENYVNELLIEIRKTHYNLK